MKSAVLPGLFDPSAPARSPGRAETTREKKRGHVRQTSIAQYAIGREQFKGRKADVLRWLAHATNLHGFAPTSAELRRFVWLRGLNPNGWTGLELLLYVRRGLSDLQRSGVVQSVPNGKRECSDSQRVCETWRVIPVGR